MIPPKVIIETWRACSDWLSPDACVSGVSVKAGSATVERRDAIEVLAPRQ